jgi:hypothetical protein
LFWLYIGLDVQPCFNHLTPSVGSSSFHRKKSKIKVQKLILWNPFGITYLLFPLCLLYSIFCVLCSNTWRPSSLDSLESYLVH